MSVLKNKRKASKFEVFHHLYKVRKDNIYAESGFKPTNLQNAYEKKLGYTDDTYTAAVDNGSYGNFVKDSAGYGLAQWTYWSRKQALMEYARSVGKSIGDLGMPGPSAICAKSMPRCC